MAHPDLSAEQAYLDGAYERLETLRAETQAQLKEAFSERGGTFQSYTERDIRVRTSLSRLEKLQLGREALVFGRIDSDGAKGFASGGAGAGSVGGSGSQPGNEAVGSDAAGSSAVGGAAGAHGAIGDGARTDGARTDGPRTGGAESESFHIGRLAISDEDHEPLVVDWRAPVAEPFYRATGAQPMGLSRRRHFLTEGRRVIDLEDELFATDGGGGVDGAAALGLSGPSVLRAALERAHTGRMRDIVATVQAEQDETVRAPLPGALVVQGGPGTGKTAVALHRAAYLLYTHRFPLESQGVLVVGPNLTFLRYIDQVLPSLGETGAELSTAVGLYKGARPSGTEAAAVSRLKGDPRMAQLVRRAVRQRERPLRKAVPVPYGRALLSVTPEASEEIVTAARRRPGTHNSRRRAVEDLLWQHLADQMERRRLGAPPVGTDGEPVPVARPSQIGAEVRRLPAVAELLERMWPRLSAEEFLHDLLGALPLIEQAGRGLLSPAEIRLLHRPRSSSAAEVGWAPADIALLDEASWLLVPSPRPTPARGDAPLGSRSSSRSSSASGPGPLAGAEQLRTYGHIVVDEAQDLTPMELRMVARRSLNGSMTLVGDIAQATGPWAPASWEELMAHMPSRRNWRQVGLSVSYRAPAEVMELAARVLAAALPGTEPPEPVRQTGQGPRVISVPSADAGLAAPRAAGMGPAAPRAAEMGPAAPRLTAPEVSGSELLGPELLGRYVAGVVEEELAAVASTAGGEDGSVGVLVPPSLLEAVHAGLAAAGVIFGEVGAGALDTQVSLLGLADAKGLEFDAVVVVEPAQIVSMAPQGMRLLYVALTRCTRRLAIVHAEPLPAPMLG